MSDHVLERRQDRAVKVKQAQCELAQLAILVALATFIGIPDIRKDEARASLEINRHFSQYQRAQLDHGANDVEPMIGEGDAVKELEPDESRAGPQRFHVRVAHWRVHRDAFKLGEAGQEQRRQGVLGDKPPSRQWIDQRQHRLAAFWKDERVAESPHSPPSPAHLPRSANLAPRQKPKHQSQSRRVVHFFGAKRSATNFANVLPHLRTFKDLRKANIIN